jgi:CheY-like chemotaxis protein
MKLEEGLSGQDSFSSGVRNHEQIEARILLVEDNLSNQFVAKSVLRLFGCEVDIASNGVEAIAKVQENRYDLVFMDCFMPLVDGFEATREIRNNESTGRRTPIVAMTAHAVEGAREECLNAGMDDYLTKPLKIHSVREILLKFIPIKGSLPPAETTPDSGFKDDKSRSQDQGSSSERAWDRDFLLENIGGNQQIFLDIIQAFLEDLSPIVEDLRTTTRDLDFEAIRQKSHRISGSAANLGAEKVSRSAHLMEIAAKSNQGQACLETLVQLLKDFDELSREMRAALKSE